jgi:small subunit ribosomal protein S6
MLMTEYETTMVLRPDLGGDAVETTLDRVREVLKTGGGKLLAINHWGKKKLAYDVKKQPRGIYVHTQFLGKGGLVAELERNLRISDNVLRFMTIQVAVNVDPKSKDEKQYVRPSYVEEAPAEEHGFEVEHREERFEEEEVEGHDSEPKTASEE